MKYSTENPVYFVKVSVITILNMQVWKSLFYQQNCLLVKETLIQMLYNLKHSLIGFGEISPLELSSIYFSISLVTALFV